MANGKKTWWNSWIGVLVGLGTIGTMILGVLTWQYDTFATEEEVEMGDNKSYEQIAQLSKETIKGFESINKTNMQMQTSIRRFDLEDSYDQQVDRKYRILKLLELDPDNQELKMDLEKCRSKITIIENELKELKTK